MTNEDIGTIVKLGLILLLIGAGVAFTVLLWTTIYWTFQVNFVWGLVWLIASQIIFGGGLKVTTSARKS